MQQIDADGSGEVDFEEFAAVMATRADVSCSLNLSCWYSFSHQIKYLYTNTTQNEHAEKELQEIRATFNLFDSDRSGRVEADELRRALNILGIKLTKPEVDFLMSEIDEDKSGDISYEEFMNYVVQFDSKHKSHDPADHH